MSLKEEITNNLADKKKVHLKEIYTALEGRSPHAIRATLNLSIKKGENVFERLGEGYYRLPNGKVKAEDLKEPEESEEEQEEE